MRTSNIFSAAPKGVHPDGRNLFDEAPQRCTHPHTNLCSLMRPHTGAHIQTYLTQFSAAPKGMHTDGKDLFDEAPPRCTHPHKHILMRPHTGAHIFENTLFR